MVMGIARGERSPAVRAYLAVAFSLSFWLVLEVGVFASRHVQRIEERDLLRLGRMQQLRRGLLGEFSFLRQLFLAAQINVVNPI